ncbi:hypothetical protein QJS10_CPA05g00060 [Acorus calamus]|uniref:Uncharacterized protein n=1 Tax=Acorus calamus TaxID=4465 RepID=A0AAV9EXA5_ACOCL|nr:hypothetical protein QJS10_CPA05g00060 [Acorus calamus]
MATENAPTDQTSNGQPSNEKVTDDIKNIEQEVISESRKDEEVKPTVEEPTSTEPALTEPVKEVEEKKTELMVVVPTKEDTKEPAPIVEDSSSTEVVSSKQEDEIKETDVPAVDDKAPNSDILTVDQSKGLEETDKDSEAPTVSEPIIEVQQKELIEQTNSTEIPDTGDKEVEANSGPRGGRRTERNSTTCD